MSLTMGELFAGIGGFSVGLHRAGFETRWAVEWDRDCRRVLRYHWPGLEIHGDICEVDPARLEHVDVITFGSPCQDLSVAGRRAGLGGARSGLFYEACRIIAGVRPAIAVWENVPGAFSSNRGRDFGAVLDALADLGALDIGWRVLDAQWFGVAQRRRRVFVVADFRGFRASEILALADGLSGHPPPRRTSGKGIAAALSASTACRGTDDPDRLSYIAIQDAAIPREKRQNGIGIAYDAPMYTLDSYGAHAVAATVSAKWAKGTGGPAGDEVQNLVAYQCHGTNVGEAGTLRQGNGGVTGGVPFVVDLAQVTSPGNYSNPQPGDPCHPLTSAANQSVVAFTNRGNDTTAAETLRSGSHGALPMVAQTLTSNGDAQNGHRDEHGLIASPIGSAVRRLTPRECERLQGFEDDWTLVDGMADSPRYRMLGNAVAVPVVEWIGRRIAEALA